MRVEHLTQQRQHCFDATLLMLQPSIEPAFFQLLLAGVHADGNGL
jgi:hypothetical protein